MVAAKTEKYSSRLLKKQVFGLLTAPDWPHNRDAFLSYPGRQVVNPLFSFFHATDEILKWRAVTAMGRVVAALAESEIESARVVMRRLMWNLNDESGGIGWGSPEAMGEITARNVRLADEFSNILVSYVREDGNYLEHPLLQRGALWGLGRLAHARPEKARGGAAALVPFLKRNDPHICGLAAWAAAALPFGGLSPALKALSGDQRIIRIYLNRQLTEKSVGALAREASSNLTALRCNDDFN